MTDERAPKRTEKLQLMLNDLELAAIEDWRFEHRIPTRAAAIRELIRRGLQLADAPPPPADQTSQKFSIVEPNEIEPPAA